MKRILLSVAPALLALTTACSPSLAGYRGAAHPAAYGYGQAGHALGGWSAAPHAAAAWSRPAYAGGGYGARSAAWRPAFHRPAYGYGYGRRGYGYGVGYGSASGYDAGVGYGVASSGYDGSYPSQDAAYATPANIAHPCCGSSSYAYPTTTSYAVPETTEQTFYRTRRVEVLRHYYVTQAYTRPVTTYRTVQQYVAPAVTTHVCGCEQ